MLRFFQVDVFASRPFTGNGLGVFPEASSLTAEQMLLLTQELRQFECVFLTAGNGASIGARIFTVDEELPFAGHPVLGAGALLHHLSGSPAAAHWSLELSGGRRVEVDTLPRDGGFRAETRQGVASFGKALEDAALLPALDLSLSDLVPSLPLQVVSTGLPYLVIPLVRGLERARIVHRDFEALLARHGAKFVYLLDVAASEGRTWDNRGAVEDVATGSAVGPAAAYLVAHGRATPGAWQTFSQGRFAGRASELRAHVSLSGEVTVQGSAFVVAEGRWCRLPEPVFR